MWFHTEGGIVGLPPTSWQPQRPQIFYERACTTHPYKNLPCAIFCFPTWPDKVSCMKLHLTWATTVSTGHQLLWSVGLLIEGVVSQAKITDRVGFGNGFSLCEDVYTHHALYLGEQKWFSCEGTCVCVSLAEFKANKTEMTQKTDVTDTPRNDAERWGVQAEGLSPRNTKG